MKNPINVLNTIAMVKQYPTWSDEFSRKEVVAALDKYVSKISWTELMVKETTCLLEYGFARWNDNLLLIPLYLWDSVPEFTELTCINGKKYIKGCDKIDLDVRFGCIAYGIER